MKRKLLFALMALALCAVEAQVQRQRSEALEIARATTLRGAVRDISRDDLEKALAGSPDMTLNYALDALGVATGVFDKAASLSRLGEAGVFAALALFAPTEGPETWPAIFGWMPRQNAPTPREAKILFVALQSALLGHAISVDAESRRNTYITIEGPRCSPCEFRSQVWLSATPAKVRAPQILDRYPAYRWGGPQANGSIGGYPLVEGQPKSAWRSSSN